MPSTGVTALGGNAVTEDVCAYNLGPFGAGRIRISNWPRSVAYSLEKIFYLRFPHWLAVLVLGTFPLWRFKITLRNRRTELRRKHGLCANCGYDLRASKDRCPECGTAIASPVAEAVTA